MPETRFTDAEIKKIIACVPFIEPDAGVKETQAAMIQLLADRDLLREEVKSWREWFANRDEEGFVPMANVKSRLDAIAATDAAGAMEDK